MKYRKGGWLPRGLTRAINRSGKAEVVFSFPNLVGSEAEVDRIVREALAESRKDHPRLWVAWWLRGEW